MEINIGNKTIISTDFSDSEIAWKIEDAVFVLEHLKNKNKIILGGDIFTEKLEHSYDSWYYNVESDCNHEFNVNYSIKLAIEYISNYIKQHNLTSYQIHLD